MFPLPDAAQAFFRPVFWVLPHPGTNGQLTQWGPSLAGAAPPAAMA